jgi:hypothetical protein
MKRRLGGRPSASDAQFENNCRCRIKDQAVWAAEVMAQGHNMTGLHRSMREAA